jgi:hypothetical protein
MRLVIRDAEPADLDAIATLADERRVDYERAQPLFWKRADDALTQHRSWLTHLLASDEVISLAAVDAAEELIGFLFATLVPAPPVYAPGGPTGLIDDFAVAASDLWATTGVELLDAARAELQARGAAQVVVVCGAHDEPKRTTLASAGLGVASEWFVGTL